MTLTVKLAEKEQQRLGIIAVAMRARSQSDAVRMLINEKFEALQDEKTLVERRGGHPQHLLDEAPNLSERNNRKSVVAKKLAAKVFRRAH